LRRTLERLGLWAGEGEGKKLFLYKSVECYLEEKQMYSIKLAGLNAPQY
jgi:hypothetical protein